MNSKDDVVVTARGVYKTYDSGRINVLTNINLEVRAGERVALWGSSGSGKSTLLHLLGGLDRPDRGELRVCGIDPVDESKRLQLRRHHVGFVFQLHNLIADLTLEENLRLPLLAQNRRPELMNERVSELLEILGIKHRRKHRIQDLSGGERQRAAIGRALVCRPSVILADEPTGSLDERSGENVFNLLRHFAQHENVAVIMATHERRFAENCERCLHLRDGSFETL